MTMTFRFSSLAALAAGVSLVATPVSALDMPTRGPDSIAVGVSDQDGWRYGRRHRDRGIDAGDVIAGVLVLGAIAAIAGAADSSSRDDDRRREERYPEPDYRSRDDARTQNYQSSRGIDSAVEMCVEQVERGSERVDSVDNAARTADGWRVSGELDGGAPWNCWIDNDGRIREIDLADAGTDYSTAAAVPAGRQLSDEEYARARAGQRGAAASMPADTGQQPAYPGGPLPGEEGYEESLQLTSTT